MRVSSKRVRGFVFIGAAALLGGLVTAAPQPRQDNGQQAAPDNSKTNKRDRDKNSPTADRQKMNPTDRDLAKRIRSAITDDKSLSTYAHNIKIISQNGTVTLKGPVQSDSEVKSIMSKATEAAGSAGKVVNEMSVKP